MQRILLKLITYKRKVLTLANGKINRYFSFTYLSITYICLLRFYVNIFLPKICCLAILKYFLCLPKLKIGLVLESCR